MANVPAKLHTLLLRAALGLGVITGASIALTPTSAAAAVPSLSKIAMVDMQRVLNETSAGKNARKNLEASSKAKQVKVDKKRAKLEADQAKLQKLSGQQLAAAQEKLQKDLMELQSMAYTLEQELASQHNKLLEKMYKNSASIVADLARKRGIDLVLVRDQMTVIYTKDSLDITGEVVKIYDKKHK